MARVGDIIFNFCRMDHGPGRPQPLDIVGILQDDFLDLLDHRNTLVGIKFDGLLFEEFIDPRIAGAWIVIRTAGEAPCELDVKEIQHPRLV